MHCNLLSRSVLLCPNSIMSHRSCERYRRSVKWVETIQLAVPPHKWIQSCNICYAMRHWSMQGPSSVHCNMLSRSVLLCKACTCSKSISSGCVTG